VWNRLSPLREAAIRFAAAWVYRRRGWRTPRWRTLRRVLPPHSARTLRRVLGLLDAEEARGALRQLERVRPLPDEVQARIRAGEWEEAVLLARRELERDFLAPRGRSGGRRWARLSPRLLRAVQRLHGAPSEDDLAAALRDTQSLARDLRVLSWFSPRVEQLLLEPRGPLRV
jgi:hypothetical protein